MIVTLILTVIIAILGIAMGSIGIQYYNKCPTLQDDSSMKRNRNFLIAMLVLMVILLVGAIGTGVYGGGAMKTMKVTTRARAAMPAPVQMPMPRPAPVQMPMPMPVPMGYPSAYPAMK
jgi:xanthine/uracil permease